MHLNVTNVEIFAREDTRLDRTIKVIGIVLSTVLFLNAFFGYWISLNQSEFDTPGTNWGLFCFVVIVFYISVKALSFTGFLAVVYQWERVLLGVSCSAGLLFVLGLFNSGLRSNFFCFILLFFNAIFYAILYLHLQSIEQCKARGHHYTCRGCCIRHEKVKFVDDRLFSGKPTMVGIFGTTPGVEGPQGTVNDTHISFSNDPELTQPKSTTNLKTIPDAATLTSAQQSLAARSLSADTGANVSDSSADALRRSTSQQQHRRQPSQGQSISHLDASSLLQI